jgi:beta-glucosidase
MADIDRSVRRVLRQKLTLGLFERPYVDPERAVQVTHTKEHQDLSYKAAQRSIVLLKNEGILPLKKGLKSIAIIGPNADDNRNQLGDYVPHSILQDVVTVLAGIRQKVSPVVKIAYAKGCEVLGTDKSGFAEAQLAAKSAEVAIVVLGENAQGSRSKSPTDGEGFDVASLDLTGVQEDLVRAVVETGTPTVVVLVNGRPLSTRWIAEHVPAIVEAWLPGERGGLALADVLFGDYNPSGRLSITIPRHSGQLPVYYNYKPSKDYWIKKGWGKRYVDMSAAPLYDFGFGLSYTKFEYSNLKISPAAIGPAGEIQASVDIRNSGQREGSEVVQLYINDEISSVARPIKELKGFAKVSLKPDETKTVQFKLTPEELSFLDQNLNRVVEPGAFNVMIGASSTDIRLTGKFELR